MLLLLFLKDIYVEIHQLVLCVYVCASRFEFQLVVLLFGYRHRRRSGRGMGRRPLGSNTEEGDICLAPGGVC